MTSDRLSKVDNIDDAMAMTAGDLSSSNVLSQNVTLRNTLQKSVGALKSTSNGFSAAQLRNQKIKRRRIDKSKATAALPLIEKQEFDHSQHAMTVGSSNLVSPIGENNNERWFRGNLYQNNEIVDYNNVSTISSTSSANLKSVISSDTERKQAVESLQKKVIQKID